MMAIVDESTMEAAVVAEVVLYTDGACSRNPGPGGWAFILRHVPTGKTVEMSGVKALTTNNQMELQAVIEGLGHLTRSTRIHVVTDSSYVKQGITEWMVKWKSHGWKRKTKGGLKPVKNIELWKELDALSQQHQLSLELVRGHTGHAENERCDELAVQAYKRFINGSS
ncbi:MAG: ribonuclease HI [Acidobacteriota bacterium]|nr:ribonuclease HI [Acidobacteriota bacterium]